jgi:hypothetical protein
MRHRGSAQRSLPVAPDAHDESVDQDFLHRFSTEISVHEKTKICFRNQQVTERESLSILLSISEPSGRPQENVACLNRGRFTQISADDSDDEFPATGIINRRRGNYARFASRDER